MKVATPKLIVIEGVDGIGKHTQAMMLGGHHVTYPDPLNPQIKAYLSGELKANAYQASMLFALDHYALYQQWKDRYEQGELIVADRYVTSNLAYQSMRATVRVEFLNWLWDLEYTRLGLPIPTKVILLDVPPHLNHLKDRPALDAHEQDLNFQLKAYHSYKDLASRYGWTVIKCHDDIKLLPKEEIHEMIKKAV